MNNKTDNYLEHKISGKALVVPFIAIATFLLITGSISYSYFAFKSVSSNNTSYSNASFPGRCNKTFIALKDGDCTITSNTHNTSVNFDDSYISSKEMTSAYMSNRVATASCNINATINGCAGDHCTFDVILNNVAGYIYTPCASITSSRVEYTGNFSTISSSGTSYGTETQMNTLTVGQLSSAYNLAVASSDSAQVVQFSLTTNFYNIPTTQQCFLTGSARTIKHQMKITNLTCDFSH